jgi:hypothetical protein
MKLAIFTLSVVGALALMLSGYEALGYVAAAPAAFVALLWGSK